MLFRSGRVSPVPYYDPYLPKVSLDRYFLEKISRVNCGLGLGTFKINFKRRSLKGKEIGEYNMYLHFESLAAPGS